MRIRTILPIAVVMLFLSLIGFSIKRIADFGEFRTLRPHQPGVCQPVLGVYSSEDMAIDPFAGGVYISGDNRRPPPQGSSQGGIFYFSLESRPERPSLLTSDLPFEFHPHGISLLKDPEAGSRLFVVNHRAEGDYVEVFDARSDSLEHVESISGAELYNLNDVAAFDSHTFYLTRDHGAHSAAGKLLEDIAGPGRASVLFYDGSQFKTVADGLDYANGISMSPDHRILYVAETLSGNIRRYLTKRGSGDLTALTPFQVQVGIDNVEVTEDGVLWVAAHPKLLTFLQYSRDPARQSPSQVFRIRFNAPGDYEIEEIYLGNGEYLSGSSVAGRWHDFFLIGSVFDRRFLLCKLGGLE